MSDEPPIEPGAPIGPPVPPKALNPAHAILVGAVLSAIVTLVGVTLNIRSSERLSKERDKRDAAVAEANSLKGKVGDLETRLDDALAKIPSTVVSTSVVATELPATTVAPPLPSIVVIVNTAAPVSVAPVLPNLPVSTLAPKPSTATTVFTAATTLTPNSTSVATSPALSTTTSTTTSTSTTTLA